ncbi:hypothetical protein [Streptomyces rugosispiralis]|uniref:Integral membrane protein n=1 Tax=Streptomyces rugosispiralis TaxID=2967341 RepID=A0ABT1V5L5_9ACTN|nr:hypothetical protein [Streptomyces rugosispiralis]MCQ8192679.1 hypothetical protein [Streptomyces rugosispiralis]
MDSGTVTTYPSRRRLVPAMGLLLLSPISAEYLIGYDQTTGQPVQLLAGLLVLAPLYGTVAVLIREASLRARRGWPTVLLLSAAFGLIEAGLIDQSLFNPHVTGNPVWDQDRLPTLISGTGVSAHYVTNFVIGHVIWSFAAPIAVVESCAPQLADRPWLRKGGVITMVALYLAAATLVNYDQTKNFTAGRAQLATTAALALSLALAAFAIPPRGARTPGRIPPLWLVGCGTAMVLTAHHLMPVTWPGVALDMLVLTAGGCLLLRWSKRARWRHPHILAVGGTALAVNAALSFTIDPLGAVSYPVKYSVNATLFLGVLALLVWAGRRLQSARRSPSDTTERRY